MPENQTVLARPETRFEIPESSRTYPTDPKSVTMRPLTLREEMEAEKAAAAMGGTRRAEAAELVRRMVVAVDDKPVDWGSTGPNGPEWYERCSPKVRDIIAGAYLPLNVPSEEERQAFLASRRVSV